MSTAVLSTTTPNVDRWSVVQLKIDYGTSALPTKITVRRRLNSSSNWNNFYPEFTGGVGVFQPIGVVYPVVTGGPITWNTVARSSYQEWYAIVEWSTGERIETNIVSITTNNPVMSSRVVRTPIDCAAYIGKSVSNIPIIHTAPQGTALSVLKNNTPLDLSFFHSNSPFIMCTAIHEINASTTPIGIFSTSYNTFFMTSTLARSLDNRALLFSFRDRHTGEWVNYQPSLDGVRTPTIKFRNSSTTSSGAYNPDYWVVGETIGIEVMPKDLMFFPVSNTTSAGADIWDKMRIYVLNINVQPNLVSLVDLSSVSNPSGVYIDDTAMYVNQLNLNIAYPLTAIPTGPMRSPNYVDDIIPIDGAYIPGTSAQEPKYLGKSTRALQILGSRSSSGWNIQPNKGVITKGGQPWWDAAFGRTRLSFNPIIDVHTFNTMSSYTVDAGIGTLTKTHYFQDNSQTITSNLTHYAGAIYGVTFKTAGSTSNFSPSIVIMSLETGVKSNQLISKINTDYKEQTYITGEGKREVLWSLKVTTYCRITRLGTTTLQVNIDSFYEAFHATPNPSAGNNYPLTWTPAQQQAQVAIFQIY